MKTPKVGVIGLGAGKRHLLEQRKQPQVEVVVPLYESDRRGQPLRIE